MYKKINVFIVEDNIDILNLLKRDLEKYFKNLNIVGQSTSVETAITNINSCNPDLLFLDIQLEDGTSFDILDRINMQDKKIIFVTGYDSFAVKSFEYNATDYLLKPYGVEDLIRAVNKCVLDINRMAFFNREQIDNLKASFLGGSQNIISISSIDRTEIVKVKDIVYLQSNDRYTIIYLKNNKTITACKNLGQYEEILSKYFFHRIHNSYIMNLNYLEKISKVDGYSCIVSTGSTLPISRRRMESLNAKIKIMETP